jgi:hypothetical protein
VRQNRRKNRHLALALAALMTPATVMAAVLAVWRLAADMKFTSAFPITDGVFSHWQSWLVAALLLRSSELLLNRYGKTEIKFRETVEAVEQDLVDTRY